MLWFSVLTCLQEVFGTTRPSHCSVSLPSLHSLRADLIAYLSFSFGSSSPPRTRTLFGDSHAFLGERISHLVISRTLSLPPAHLSPPPLSAMSLPSGDAETPYQNGRTIITKATYTFAICSAINSISLGYDIGTSGNEMNDA